MDFYGFYTGKIFDAYKYLGAHVEEKGVTFRTFAPSASRITLIGEFNDWQEWEMNKVSDGNFWECYVPQAKAGQMYKYRIYDRTVFFRQKEEIFMTVTVIQSIIAIHMDLAWSFAQTVPLSFVTCQNTNSKTASGCKAAATAEKNR